MKSRLQKSIVSLFIFVVASFFSFCRVKTDEELILDLMEEVGRFAEKKDIASIMKNLADDYTDFEGRNKRQTQDMIHEYFDRYRGIVIHMLSSRIDEIAPPEAFIQTEVALSSGAAKVFRKLVRFSTDNYRFKIKLIKRNDAWQIQYAEWRYVTLEELYPESLSILKKVFPGVWD